jgi:hypothetical protein
MSSASRREAWAVAAAVAFHVALLALPARRGVALLAEGPRLALPTDVIELDTREPATPAASPSPEPARAEPPAAAPAKVASAPVEKGSATSPAPVNARSVAEAPAAPERGPAPEKGAPAPVAGAPPVARGRDDLSQPPPVAGGGLTLPPGIGGAPVWAIPGVMSAAPGPLPASTAAPAARPVDRDVASKVISASLRKQDHDLGLDSPAGGVVATTIADVVRSSAVPGDARATFEVKLGAGGSVDSVRLLSSTAGDAGTWERVVRSAKGSLGGRALAMGGDTSRGATVIVKVESSVQYPAGSKTKLDVEPVCANEIIDQIEEALKNPGAVGAGVQGPGAGGRGAVLGAGSPPEGMVWNAERKKFCIPVGIRGRGDAANFGAHAVNVVKSTFTVKRDGERSLPAGEVKPLDDRVPWARPDPTRTKLPTPQWNKKKKKMERKIE